MDVKSSESHFRVPWLISSMLFHVLAFSNHAHVLARQGKADGVVGVQKFQDGVYDISV